LSKAYEAIEHDSNCKSELTLHAVRQLAELDFDGVADAITKMDHDVNEQWELAVRFTAFSAFTVAEAADWGGEHTPMRNDVFCTRICKLIMALWRDVLLAPDSTAPSSEVMAMAEAEVGPFAPGYNHGLSLNTLLGYYKMNKEREAASNRRIVVDGTVYLCP
jgi:hypothetical protein